MKNIKVLLKLTLIVILGFIIFGFAKYGSIATSTTIYKSDGYLYIKNTKATNANIASLVRSNVSDISTLSYTDLKTLRHAKMVYGTGSKYGGDTRAPNQICLAHWDVGGDDTDSYWTLDVILKISCNSSDVTYTAYNIVYESSDDDESHNKTISLADDTNSLAKTQYRYIIKLAYALYNMYNESYTDTSGEVVYPIFTPEKAVVGYYLRLLYSYNDSDKYGDYVVYGNYITDIIRETYSRYGVNTQTEVNNDNSNLDEEDFEDDTGLDFDELMQSMIDDAADYYDSVVDFEAVSVDSSSAKIQSSDTSSSTKSLIVGPLTVSYGGKSIESISIYNGSSTSAMSVNVYWSESISGSWSSKYSNIDSGDEIYLKITGSSLPSSSTFKIKFNQETLELYNSVILMFGREQSNSQQQGVVASADPTEVSRSASVTIENIAYTSISIIKTDSLTDNLISGIGFQIYYTSSGTKYYLCANSSGVYTGWSTTPTTHYTDDNGAINISSIPLQYDTTLTVTVQEVSTSSTQLYYIEDTNIIESQTLTTSHTSSNPLIFYLDNDPLSLTIEKRKNTTTGTLMNGVGFKLKYSDGTWVYGTGNGHKSYTSTGTTYTTGNTSTGKVTITGLKKGTYTIYEVSIDGSVSPGYYLENQTGYDSSTGMVCWGTVTLNTSGQTSYTAGPYANITGALQITKYDEDGSTKLSGFKFVFVWASSTSSTTYKYIYGTPGSTANPYAAISTGNYNTYTTDSNGQIKVEYLKAGIYYIYEIGTSGEPYYLEDQDEASNEPTSLKNSSSISSSWKYQGYIKIDSSTTLSNPATTIHTSSSTTTTKILNYKRIKIAGYVWVDEDISKDDTYNSLYDRGTETLVEGVTVYLYNKTTGQVTVSSSVKNLTTSSDGSYTFGYEWGVQYRYISNYYIKFDYGDLSIKEAHDATEASSGTEFIPVAFNRGTSTTSTIYANSSKAMMDSVAKYDVNLTGKATTYTGTSDSYEELYGLSAFLSSSNETLYNSGTYTLTNINLGIKKIYDPDYEIAENLMYVKMDINGYSYLYEYGYTDVVEGDPSSVNVPTVSFQDGNDHSCYTRYMYPSDLKQRLTNDEEDKLEVYVVYGITIKNTTTYNVSELYMESTLNITSLTNNFDNSRYELDTTSNLDSDEGEYLGEFTQEDTCNNTFAYWEMESNSTDTATYNLDDADEPTKIKSTGISGGESETIYIQFRITDEGIIEILNSSDDDLIVEDSVTNVTSEGYHTYTRSDYSWTNTTTSTMTATQTHYTASETKYAEAPYLRFILGTDRVLSGIVFEDTDEDDNGDEILGNGIYDDDENTVAYVKVELLDSSGNTAKIYSYSYDSTTGTATASSSDASYVITGNTGEFSFTGFIPGEYYLKFTYYDKYNEEIEETMGESLKTTIVSSDGTTETFSLNDYKSTIVTSEAAMNAINKKYSNVYDEDAYTIEWYKNIDGSSNTSDDAENYSLAVDDLDQREDYNDGLVYTYQDDDNDGEIDTDEDGNQIVYSHSYTTDENGDTEEITKMEAETAVFSITVENTSEDHYTNCIYYEYTDSNGNIITSLTNPDPDGTKGISYELKVDIDQQYEYKGFNFGIVEQAVQSVKVEKVITNISMVNSPTTIFNGNPETGDLDGVSDLDGSTNGSSTYTRIEIEEDDMYGANLTVTYTLTITNTSDLNYYETSDYYQGYYYMFGLHGSSYYSEEIKISIDSVLDTYDNDLTWLIDNTTETTYTYKVTSSASNDSTSEGYLIETDATEQSSSTLTGDTYTTWEMVSSSEDNEDDVDNVEVYDIAMTLAENKANARSNKGYDFYDGEVLYLDDWGDISRSESFTLSVVFTKTMSSSDDDTSYENVATVNKLSITENSNSSISTDRDSTKYVRKPQVPDPADSYITISPPTGESTEPIIPYIVMGAIGLIILSVGIVIIKKKVL